MTTTDQVSATVDIASADSTLRHLQLWESLSSLEDDARTARMDLLRPLGGHSGRTVRLTSTWRQESSTLLPGPRPPGQLSPETQALRDWIESDDLDWDAIERARDEAWGD